MSLPDFANMVQKSGSSPPDRGGDQYLGTIPFGGGVETDVYVVTLPLDYIPEYAIRYLDRLEGLILDEISPDDLEMLDGPPDDLDLSGDCATRDSKSPPRGDNWIGPFSNCDELFAYVNGSPLGALLIEILRVSYPDGTSELFAQYDQNSP